MIRILIFIAVTLFGLQSNAQTVTIRSGDHASFTRLVLTVGDQQRWSLDKSENGFVLVNPSFEGDFDLSGIFERIQRTRLNDLSIAPSGLLELQLNCPCYGDIFPYGSTQIVVDIIDGPAPEDWSGPTFVNADTDQVPVEEDEEEIPQLPVIFSTQVAKSAPKPVLPPILQPEFEQIEEITEEMQTQLLGQLAQAAAQGLLSPNQTEVASVPTNAPSNEDIEEDSIALNLIQDSPEPSNLGIAARTSFDELADLLSPSLGGQIDTVCRPTFDHKLSQWTFGSDFNDGLGRVRMNQARPNQDPLTSDKKDIIRHYLYYGFGAEASALLKGEKESTSESQFLSEIAALLDNPQTYNSTYFLQYSDCVGELGLWAFLSNAKGAKSIKMSAKNLAQIKQKLPLHLQTHLGAVWVQRLREAGLTDLAITATKVVESLSIRPSNDLNMQSALIALDQDQDDQAEVLFEEIANSTDSIAADGFIEMLKIQIEQGGIPKPEQITLLDAYSRENVDADRGKTLSELAALARVMSGDISDGLQRYSGLGLSQKKLDRDMQLVVQHSSQQSVISLAQQISLAPNENGLPQADRSTLIERVRSYGFDALAGQLDSNSQLSQTASAAQEQENDLLVFQTENEPVAFDQPLGLKNLLANIKRSQDLRKTVEEDLKSTMTSSVDG
ncbi:hypothetical protein [Algirhabdus cladophorae]|uniref:hypothetical protein n=1 Tax=Algirhabdus cladophorae TaxID=3377108 RepID=UPI003B84B57A